MPCSGLYRCHVNDGAERDTHLLSLPDFSRQSQVHLFYLHDTITYDCTQVHKECPESLNKSCLTWFVNLFFPINKAVYLKDKLKHVSMQSFSLPYLTFIFYFYS